MPNSSHYRNLERMFQSAPINQGIYEGTEIVVSERSAILELDISKKYFHAADAMHGSIYFKLLDDAAYFASASLETEYFMLTKSYEIQFRRPVQEDRLIAQGNVVEVGEKEIRAESSLMNRDGKLVAAGIGIFVRGPRLLSSITGFLT